VLLHRIFVTLKKKGFVLSRLLCDLNYIFTNIVTTLVAVLADVQPKIFPILNEHDDVAVIRESGLVITMLS